MKERIREGWHKVLVALMNDDTAKADRERARVEALVKVQRARRAVAVALSGVL